jgi:anaerobic magnesium-protoporphyrin IX monomethyl ester cyclase
MLSIQVGHAYFLRYDRKQWERGKPYPPLATLQVAALLREQGHQVGLFDAMLAEGVEDYAAALSAQAPQVVVLYEDNFNYLTKMCLNRMREAACRMIGEARAHGARVIVAGSDASDQPEAFLAAGADAVLLGEGIDALLQLVERWDREGLATTSTTNIPGVATPAESGTRPLRIGAQPPDPRLAGLAAWDLVQIERYRTLWRERHGYFSLNMAASRGCPFRCHWCAKPIWGNHYKQRGPADVAAEMIHLKRAFRPDHVWMADDIFGFHVHWVEAFADHLRAADGSVPFTIQTRADLSSERMVAALAKAGCAEAWIGAESGSQQVLDRMNKGTTVAELIAARERFSRHGIRVGFFVQLGYLGERLEDIQATRALLAQAAPDDIGVSVSYPLPGTKFYEQVKAQLGKKTHWEESNDLAMMFRGAYESEFYRSVRNLLHEQVVSQVARDEAGLATLDKRWDALMAEEMRYRRPDATPADVETLPPSGEYASRAHGCALL